MSDGPSVWRRLVTPVTLAFLWMAAAFGLFRATGSTAQGALLLALPGVGLLLSIGPASRAREVLAVAAPLAMLLLLVGRLTSWWWTGDDPCLLASVAQHGGLAHFWSPEVWRPLSGTLLMPWLLGSLAVDWAVFGLGPGGFYLHQLLVVASLLVVVYALARVRLTPFGAGAVAFLLAVSAPLLSVASELAARHYVEGTLLVLAAAFLFVRSVSSGRAGTAVAGAACFALAMTAKEVFVPMVALLPLLPVGTLKQRLRRAVPFVVAAAAYAPWRVLMLGPANVLGGYLPSGLALPPGRVGLWLAAAGLTAPWQVVVVVVLVGASATVLVRDSRRPGASALTGLVVASLLVGPLLPILAQLSDRHLLLPWLVGSAAVGLGLGRAGRTWPAAATLATITVLLFSLATLSRSSIWREQGRLDRQYRVEGEHVLAAEGPGVVVSGVPHSHYLSCLRRLRVGVLGEPRGPGFCTEPCACAGLEPGAPRLQYAHGRLEARAADITLASCETERPLRVEMRYDEGRGQVAWDLGPHPETGGHYGFILVFGEEGSSGLWQPIARQGEVALTLRDPLRLVVGYRAAEGWQTSTPTLTLDPESARLSWSRCFPEFR